MTEIAHSNPDPVLAELQRDVARQTRGKLKVFFGMAPDGGMMAEGGMMAQGDAGEGMAGAGMMAADGMAAEDMARRAAAACAEHPEMMLGEAMHE